MNPLLASFAGLVPHSGRALAVLLAAGLSAPAHAFNPDTVSPAVVHLEEVDYFHAPVFADAIKMCRDWETTDTNNEKYTLDPGTGGLNAIGLPVANNANQVFTSWYEADDNKAVLRGRYVVTWTGLGDVRLTGASTDLTLISTTGANATNGGRRVYLYTGTNRPGIRLSGLDSSGLSSLNVWLPHPDDPNNTSLEPAERAAYNAANGITESAEAFYFSPVLIRVLKERPWAAIRVSKFTGTKDCVASSWSERRKPGLARQTGGLVSRDPQTGLSPELNAGVPVYRDPGVAWEYAIALCNATGRNLWACVPHLGVLSVGTDTNPNPDSFYHNLAKLIAYGSDADGNIYAPGFAGPKVFKGLNPGLDVWVEYSNEVWNSQFAQRTFVSNQSETTTVPQQMAINSLQAWLAMESVPALKSATVDRVVRLLGCQQVNGTNLKNSLTELYTAGKDGETGYAEAVVTASYFGNSIEAYVLNAILEGEPLAGSGPKYYYTPEAFARLNNSAYFDKAFDEWTRRVLSGDQNTGNAFDTTGYMGGIAPDVYAEAAARADADGKPLRVIATEGGASIYTDKLDNGNSPSTYPEDNLITDFVTEFPYRQRMADLMRLHLELGRMRTLRAYSMFNLTGRFGRNGQWGMMDLDGLHGTSDKAIRYRAVRDWFDEFSTIRHVDRRSGSAPAFTTAEDLGEFRVNTTLNIPIAVTGATSVTTVGKVFVPGNPALAVNTSAAGATITGKPSQPGLNYVFLRAMDADKDPTWRIFRFEVKTYSKNLFFNPLATSVSPVAVLPYLDHLFSTENGWLSLRVEPITSGSTNKILRVTSGVPVHFEYDTGSTEPLDNRPFNFDAIALGRSNPNVIGVRLEGLSEAGNVVVLEDIPLAGAVDTTADFTRDGSWDMLFSVRITFYGARVYNDTTEEYDITPVAGGIIDNLKVNL